MIWVILALSVVLVLGYVCVAPLVVEIDSNKGIYRLRFHQFATADLRLSETSIVVDVRIVLWKKVIDLLTLKGKPRRTSKDKKVKERKPGKRPAHLIRKVLAVVRSFRVRQCRIVIDSGDDILNAKLYPAFYMLGAWTGHVIRISFTDDTDIRLKVQNSMARMLWAYLRA